jgi:hypothetical protein
MLSGHTPLSQLLAIPQIWEWIGSDEKRQIQSQKCLLPLAFLLREPFLGLWDRREESLLKHLKKSQEHVKHGLF